MNKEFKPGDFIYFETTTISFYGRIKAIDETRVTKYEVTPLYYLDGQPAEPSENESYYTSHVKDGYDTLKLQMNRLIYMETVEKLMPIAKEVR